MQASAGRKTEKAFDSGYIITHLFVVLKRGTIMDRTVVWVVTYWNIGDKPTVTVWCVKNEAEKHLKYCKEHFENVILDEVPL